MPYLKRLTLLIPVILTLYLAGCATTEDVRILDREISRIQSQINVLQKDTQREKDTQSRTYSALKNELKSDLGSDLRKLQTDFQLRLESLQSDLRVLSTGLDEYKDYAKRPARDVERVREDVILRTRVLEEKGKILEEKSRTQEERARSLEEKLRILDEKNKSLEEKNKFLEDRIRGMEGRIEKAATRQVEAEKVPPPKDSPAEVKVQASGMVEVYNDAYQTYQRGDLEGARRKFEAFMKQYPNTHYSDNAQFWIGETYYGRKDYEKAILEYEKVITKYPEGDKVPAALLKQGLSFVELGDKANGRNLLRRVMDRYPQTEQAEIARKRLEGLK